MATVPLPDPQPGTPETLVVARVGEGFRVYSIHAPHLFYFVTGSPDLPVCTCPDFRVQEDDPSYRCTHVRAVYGNGPTASPAAPLVPPALGPIPAAEQPSFSDTAPPAAQMSLKRSVSPDGRIDALSIELSCVVDHAGTAGIAARAERMLELQDTIARDFLSANGRHAARTSPPAPVRADEAIPAELLTVGGMDGKWGRRLFIVVQANGRLLRLYGSPKQLGEAIAAAGFPQYAEQIGEGMTLNLPCRVTTSPSPDGRYMNIDKVLPASRQTDGPGQGR
jgi:hypothetical protein